MICKLHTLYVCLSAALSTAVLCAQSPDAVTPDATTAATTADAWVYVSYAPAIASSNDHKIAAFKAWGDGSLTTISGSPFNENVANMAVNGKYLMAASNNSTYINAYLIEDGGPLTYVSQTEYAHFSDSGHNCGGAGQIFFDHSGADLYLTEFDTSSACTNTGVASFSLNKSNGKLNFLGFLNEGAFPGIQTAAYFIGDNVYAYSAAQSGCMYPGIYGFQRQSNGNLTNVNVGTVPSVSPKPGPGFRGYYPQMGVAADKTNHVAMIEIPANPPGCYAGPLQLSSYTVASNGTISTTSTYANMPDLAIKNPSDMKMAPSGNLIAIAGTEGLQLFHFNGANPPTAYTGLITTTPIDQMFWDNNNHLFAISQTGGKLFVFNITSTTWKQAPGSPHALADPYAIIVQPLPR